MANRIRSVAIGAIAVVFALSGGLAWAGAGEPGHGHGPKATEMKAGEQTIEQMREMHKAHDHGHDFEAMEHMNQAELGRMMAFITDVGIALPPMNSERGRVIFLEKGCIACHAAQCTGTIVGVGKESRGRVDLENVGLQGLRFHRCCVHPEFQQSQHEPQPTPYFRYECERLHAASVAGYA